MKNDDYKISVSASLIFCGVSMVLTIIDKIILYQYYTRKLNDTFRGRLFVEGNIIFLLGIVTVIAFLIISIKYLHILLHENTNKSELKKCKITIAIDLLCIIIDILIVVL